MRMLLKSDDVTQHKVFQSRDYNNVNKCLPNIYFLELKHVYKYRSIVGPNNLICC